MLFYMIMGHKREHPDYKSYCYDKYALRCAKCALDELSSNVIGQLAIFSNPVLKVGKRQ